MDFGYKIHLYRHLDAGIYSISPNSHLTLMEYILTLWSILMIRILAIAIGLLFVISGVMGFIPEIVHEGKLFGIFAVSSFRNILHLATGLVGLLCGLRDNKTARFYFLGVGTIYLLMAAKGFYEDSTEL